MSHVKRLGLIAAIGVVVATGGVLVAKHLPSKPVKPASTKVSSKGSNSTARGQLAAARRDLLALRVQEQDRIHALEQQVAALSGAVEAKAPADLEDDGREPTLEEKIAQAKELEQAHKEREETKQRVLQATFDTAFESQPVDPEWSRGKRAAIEEAFAPSRSGSAPELNVKRLDCRSSLCRAELQLEGAGARQALEAALDRPGFAGGSYFHPGATPDTTVLYAFREDRPQEIGQIFKSANAAFAEARR